MKVDRLLAITILLLNRGRMSAKDLAERFEVSERTIYRDMDAISLAGIPLVSYPGSAGGFEILEHFRLERQYLSLTELQSMVTALRGIRSTLDDSTFDGLLQKVGALVAKSEGDLDAGRQPLIIDINPLQTSPHQRPYFSQLRKAIQESLCMSMTYMNGDALVSRRTVEPLRLVLKGYTWYLYGFCRLRGDFRIFRLSRIRQLTALDERFEPRTGSLDHLDVQLSTYAQHPLVSLVLHASPAVRVHVEDLFEPDEIELQQDGSIIAKTRRQEDAWLYRTLLGYGSDVKVIEPAHVVASLKDQAEKILRLYA